MKIEKDKTRLDANEYLTVEFTHDQQRGILIPSVRSQDKIIDLLYSVAQREDLDVSDNLADVVLIAIASKAGLSGDMLTASRINKMLSSPYRILCQFDEHMGDLTLDWRVCSGMHADITFNGERHEGVKISDIFLGKHERVSVVCDWIESRETNNGSNYDSYIQHTPGDDVVEMCETVEAIDVDRIYWKELD